MEENKEKVNCCENKKECCQGGMNHCCHNFKKCYLVKKIVWIILIIAAFCVGAEWGEMKAFSGKDYRFERGFRMMDVNYGRFDENTQKGANETVGEVTVKVDGQAAPKQ